ncbi:MAG: RIP metalloprotease RseP [Deltaproteobacteria bacterium]|nr:RIP metalloprotease RseP [Deltaproteobacteria bacterium]
MLTVVAAIVMLGLLIFVHELGHFFAFKAIGVKVLKFSLGFDPVLFKRQIGETSYQIGWVPIGGYVRPLGEHDDDEVAVEDRGRAVGDKPLWARSIAFAAGPVMNLVFPVLIFWVVFSLPGHELSSRVGMIIAGMPAETAGMMAGDRVVEIDGKKVEYWSDLLETISERPGRTFPVVVSRHGQRIPLNVTAEAVREVDRLGDEVTVGKIGVVSSVYDARVVVTGPETPAAEAGILSWDAIRAVNGTKAKDWIEFREAFEAAGSGSVTLQVERRDETTVKTGKRGRKDRSTAKTSELTLVVKSPGTVLGAGLDTAQVYVRDIEPGSPADTAGVKPGDKVISVDGRSVGYWHVLGEMFRRNPDKTFEIVFGRGASTFSASLKMLKRTERDEFKQEYVYYDLGAANDSDFTEGETVRRPFSISQGIIRAFETAGEIIRVTYLAVFKLVTGKLSLKTVGGPIMIFDMAGTVAKKGAMSYFWFMGLISINLGIFNLLPIPILDGGHLMLAAVEAIARRPLSRRVRMFTSYVGVAFLASMFVLVFKNDIERYWDSIMGFFR